MCPKLYQKLEWKPAIYQVPSFIVQDLSQWRYRHDKSGVRSHLSPFAWRRKKVTGTFCRRLFAVSAETAAVQCGKHQQSLAGARAFRDHVRKTRFFPELLELIHLLFHSRSAYLMRKSYIEQWNCNYASKAHMHNPILVTDCRRWCIEDNISHQLLISNLPHCLWN